MNRKDCALALRINTYQLSRITSGKEIMENVTKKIAMLKRKGFVDSIGKEVALAKVKLLYQMAKDKGCKLISKKGKQLYNWYVSKDYVDIENTEVNLSGSRIGDSDHKLRELNPKKYSKRIPVESLEALPDNFVERGQMFTFKRRLLSRINIDPIAVIRIPVEIDGHEFYFGLTRWD
jgi:hypothetical protein